MGIRALIRITCISLLGIGLLCGCKFFNKTVNAQGVYFGTFAPTGSTSTVAVYGAILPGHYGYVGTTNGTLYVLPDTIKNEAFTDNVTAFPALGQTFGNGQTVRHFTFEGQAGTDTDIVNSITGNLTGDTGEGSLTLNYKDLTTNVPSLSALAGTYQGYYWGNSTAITLTISDTGTLSFTDGFGCSGFGSLGIVPDYNLLRLNAAVSGNSVCPGSVNGLGFTDTRDRGDLFQNAPGTYIYLGMSNSVTGFIAELHKS